MRIYTNVGAMMGLNAARQNNWVMNQSTTRLSSAKQINYAADDPSGLGVAKTMEAKARGLQVATENAQEGIKYLELRDTAMAEVGDMIQRIRDLAVRASNDATLTAEDRTRLQDEAGKLVDEINKINADRNFNNMKVFDIAFDTVPGGTGGLSHAGQKTMSIDLKTYADANGGVVRVTGAWFNGSAAFPDLNIISPDGTEAFGYLYDTWSNFGNGVEAYANAAGSITVNNGDGDAFGLGTMDSAASIEYNGWDAPASPNGAWIDEWFEITDPAPGMWTIVIDNESASEREYGIFVNQTTREPVNNDRVHIGTENDDTSILHLGVFEVNSLSLGISSNFSSVASAQAAIDSADTALETLGDRRAEVGVMINRLQSIVDDNMTGYINIEAGRSNIEDADMAVEATKLTKSQIRMQSNLVAIDRINHNSDAVIDLINQSTVVGK
ncbi:MAG TPA: flagellin [bacterium]|nr:flagellin [bacterium]